uniref:LuxR C-terminal-related transcriptional regulator n=1 Tax=Salmonella enterica TaxID=28901 RepID=UPI0020CC79BE
AFSAFEQQRFGEAVAAWEMMLKLLPADDTRRAVIERSIRLAQGLSNKQIASVLNISEQTVKVHIRNLLRKLNVRSRVAATI